jgi:hypothetical protein
VFQTGTTVFWTLFDVIPLVLIFRIQRANFSTFDEADERLLCEGSEEESEFDPAQGFMDDTSEYRSSMMSKAGLASQEAYAL